jgi:putative ABC transport system permease protein
MNILTLIRREIAHRWGGFLLGTLAVAIAVGTVTAAQLFLERDRLETDQLLDQKRGEVDASVAAREADVAKAGFELEDAIRKHMTKLGFNILILPQEQDLSELHLNGTLSATMPESYVDKLANSNIVTVNHLLPTVTKRVKWPERDIDVVLVGTRGEVPIMHRSDKKPLLEAVSPGEIVLGYEVHQQLNIQPRDKVTLLGREFLVARVHPQRGTSDDVTVWISLAEAQELLGMQNLVHGILALECECAGDRIAQIRSELQAILPGTQIVERYSQALARAEARTQAKTTAEQALQQAKADGAAALQRETDARRAIESQHASLASLLVPVVVVAAAVWVGLLALLNVRQRREEIGILRAIGVSTRGVLGIFLGKALLLGLLGAAAGIGLGLAFAAARESGASVALAAVVESPPVWWTLVLAPVVAPLMAAVASWLPAMQAAHHDPALVLQGE